MKTITGIHFNPNDGAIPMEIEDSLDGYYKALDCDTIDIVRRKIGNKYFSIICDDEALLRECPVVSAMDEDMNPVLYGNLFIVDESVTKDGDLISIKGEDAAEIMSEHDRIGFRFNKDGKPTPQYVLWPVSY